jgi:hypothetical protein
MPATAAVLAQGMFLLLVTNRGSNILEDLDTLRLLSKLVPEYAGTMLDEDAVSRAAFDLIFAFDEVISLGHKENISVMQVRIQFCGLVWMWVGGVHACVCGGGLLGSSQHPQQQQAASCRCAHNCKLWVGGCPHAFVCGGGLAGVGQGLQQHHQQQLQQATRRHAGVYSC